MLTNRTNTIIFCFCIVSIILHLIGDSYSGFQGDELLHIETGRHSSMGYMEFPPLIGWIAWIQDLFGSQSVFVHHIFCHIASTLILILVAKITIELGGGARAVFIALLCILISPGFGRSQQLFQPVVFSQLFWVWSFYRLQRFVNQPTHRQLLYLAICVSLGFLAKYDIVFFIGGLTSLLFFRRTRIVVLSKATLICVALFLVVILPNLYWQWEHGFPLLQMFGRLYETQLDKLSFGSELKKLIVGMNPLTIVFWLGGLIYIFNRRKKETLRPMAISILLSIVLLVISRSKAYYFFPLILTLVPFGAVWFEERVLGWRKWILYPVATLMVLSAVVMVPFGIALMPLEKFISFARIHEKDGHIAVPYQEYYTKEKWKNTMSALRAVYDSLPPNEQKDCMIWGKHYSQAGAVCLMGGGFQLPHAFSYHGSFYLWAPTGKMPTTVIGFTNGEASIEFFRQFFDEVSAARTVYNPYADFEEDRYQTIFICKSPRQSFDEMKNLFAKRVFE